MIALLLLACALVLSACQGGVDSVLPKEKRPIPDHLLKKIKAKGMTTKSPILIRIYKSENALEVWKAKDTGRFDLLETYEICKWSGKLGPKFKEGDRQAPEGFYNVRPAQMNPRSSYHLSFNMGYPNRYDRSHGRTGSHLMVHGACSSAGCYSMTDEYVEEIYSLAREAFDGGQKEFQIQAYPFRMTAENMLKHANHPHFAFWKMLKEGNDHFEVTGAPPKVDVCEKRYVFNRISENEENFRSSAECPPTIISKRLALAFNEKQNADQAELDKLLNKQLANPFLPEEEKPKASAVSILAEPTIGPIRVVEPQPAVAEGKPDDAKPEDPSAPVAATQELDPIAQEVAGQSKPDGTQPKAVPTQVPVPSPRQPAS